MKLIDLDTVLLSQEAVSAWRTKADAFARHARDKGVDPGSIGVEQCEVMPDGSLRVFCDTPLGAVEMLVAGDDWQPALRA